MASDKKFSDWYLAFSAEHNRTPSQQEVWNAALASRALAEAAAPAPSPETVATAPWPDFSGQTIRHGDRLQHPDGTTFVAVRLKGHTNEHDAWRGIYDDDLHSVSRLCLQVGDKGRAVLASDVSTKEVS